MKIEVHDGYYTIDYPVSHFVVPTRRNLRKVKDLTIVTRNDIKYDENNQPTANSMFDYAEDKMDQIDDHQRIPFETEGDIDSHRVYRFLFDPMLHERYQFNILTKEHQHTDDIRSYLFFLCSIDITSSIGHGITPYPHRPEIIYMANDILGTLAIVVPQLKQYIRPKVNYRAPFHVSYLYDIPYIELVHQFMMIPPKVKMNHCILSLHKVSESSYVIYYVGEQEDGQYITLIIPIPKSLYQAMENIPYADTLNEPDIDPHLDPDAFRAHQAYGECQLILVNLLTPILQKLGGLIQFHPYYESPQEEQHEPIGINRITDTIDELLSEYMKHGLGTYAQCHPTGFHLPADNYLVKRWLSRIPENQQQYYCIA